MKASALVVCLSNADDEFEAVDRAGNIVHCVRPERALGPLKSFEARVLEKLIEMRVLWGGRWSSVAWRGRVGSWLITAAEMIGRGHPRRVGSNFAPPRSVSLVCCTYGRIDEPRAALLECVAQARVASVPTEVIAVVQNPGYEQRIGRDLGRVTFLAASPPGLTRARNTAVAHATGDLVVFFDDDVSLDEGWLQGYVDAATHCSWAIGFAGKVRSRHEGFERLNSSRAVGQIRMSGWVDANFDSIGDDRFIISPHTPLGANMAFRREALVKLKGTSWFDESLEGSAHREESTLALELKRWGERLAYVPHASLRHLEAVDGGCENRGLQLLGQRQRRATLERRFLRLLYQPFGLGAGLMPLPSALRAVKHAGENERWLELLAQAAALARP